MPLDTFISVSMPLLIFAFLEPWLSRNPPADEYDVQKLNSQMQLRWMRHKTWKLPSVYWSKLRNARLLLKDCAKKWCYPMRKRQQIRRKTPGNTCCLTFSGGFVDVFSSDNTIFSCSEITERWQCQTVEFYHNNFQLPRGVLQVSFYPNHASTNWNNTNVYFFCKAAVSCFTKKGVPSTVISCQYI